MRLQAGMDREPRGQVLVIVAAAMVVLIAMVGVVIDGGYAWGRQRDTQNGADAVAKAGTVVVQHAYADDTPPTDGDVGCAVDAAVLNNDVELVKAVYTLSDGTPLDPEFEVGDCDPGGGAPIPVELDAQGVKATTQQVFETYLARVMGFDQFTAVADATAVVGPQVGICAAGSGCGVLPVTFPISAVYCDGTNSQVVINSADWPILEENDPEVADRPNATNMVIIPLCSTTAGTESPGSVGWLDYGCGNLAETISDPCNLFIPIPAWVQTQTGNVNSVEDELNAYTGDDVDVAETNDPDGIDDQVVPLPIHNNTCESDPDGPDNDPLLYTAVCPEGDWSGTGSNLYYHVPYWVGFKLDQAYVQGNNVSECNSPPGNPSGVAGSGATSCLKGWFVARYDAPGTMGTGDLTPGDPIPMMVGLIE